MSLKHKIFYKKFDSLSRKEIHDLFLLRSEVFVVEQNCVYQDIDGKDEKAEHVLVKKNNKIIAYARVLMDSDPNYILIGRIVVSKKERGNSLGSYLLDFILKKIHQKKPKRPIKIDRVSLFVINYQIFCKRSCILKTWYFIYSSFMPSLFEFCF